MLLALIFAALCLPLVLGFSPATLRTRWRNCRVLGMVGYEYPMPTPPTYQRDLQTAHYAHKAGMSQEYKPRRSQSIVKDLFRFKTF